MPSGQVHWTLVFTAASLDHLAERNVEAADVVDAVTVDMAPRVCAAQVGVLVNVGSSSLHSRTANY